MSKGSLSLVYQGSIKLDTAMAIETAVVPALAGDADIIAVPIVHDIHLSPRPHIIRLRVPKLFQLDFLRVLRLIEPLRLRVLLVHWVRRLFLGFRMNRRWPCQTTFVIIGVNLHSDRLWPFQGRILVEGDSERLKTNATASNQASFTSPPDHYLCLKHAVAHIHDPWS